MEKISYTRWNNTAPVEIFHEALAKICKNGEILACQLVSSSFSSTTVQLHVSVILGEEFRSPFFCHLSQAGGFVSETSWLWLPIYTILRRTIFELCKLHSKELHLKRKLTWNPKIEVWKMIFVVNWVRFRFHVNFQGTNIFYPIPRKLIFPSNCWNECPSSHNHWSEEWVPQIIVAFQTQPFSISMICGRKSQYMINIYIYYFPGRQNHTTSYTPKTNIDIQNCHLEKVTPFKYGSYDFFGGYLC